MDITNIMEKYKMKKIITILIISVMLLIVGCSSAKIDVTKLDPEKFTVFQSPSCGCCGGYTKYVQDQGYNLNIKKTNELYQLKEDLMVPSEMYSCHTSFIAGYYVEGHVPLEAVEKLINEKPDIVGIALPGMPSGVPGMGGSKSETWIIYAIYHDGSTSEFMKI